MYFQLLLYFLFITINCVKLIGSEYVRSLSEYSNNNDACIINSNVVGKQILGEYRESENYVPYCAYLGIPYAKPPIDELRFKPPVTIDYASNSVNQYTSPPNSCISKSNKTASQSEDCLYLNIFLPLTVLQSKYKNAVVVWIHGGSYNVGSGLHNMHPIRGPELYIENGMIFVSFNYRLGPLGFLRVPELNITGNYGLMDQRFALKWVHENIHLWNGDKNNVTVMGWSAGSASVSHHLLANESNQYFNRAILMSGVLLNPWARFDYPISCLEQLLTYLAIEPDQIVRLFTINGTEFNRDRSVFFSFGSMYECFVPMVDNIMVSDSINYKLLKNIDIMIGWTNLEMQDFDLELVTVNRNFDPFKFLSRIRVPHYKLKRLFKYLKNEFHNNTAEYLESTVDDWASNNTSLFYRLESKLMSDTKIKFGIRKFVKNLQQFNAHEPLNLFMYQFSFNGKFFMHSKLNGRLEGADHGDDLAHMYRTEQNLRKNKTNYDEEYRNELFVQRSFVKMWTNFMKHGNPTPTPISPSPHDVDESLIWENFNHNNQLLDINFKSQMIPDKDDAFYQLWERLENCIHHDTCSFLDQCQHCV